MLLISYNVTFRVVFKNYFVGMPRHIINDTNFFLYARFPRLTFQKHLNLLQYRFELKQKYHIRATTRNYLINILNHRT